MGTVEYERRIYETQDENGKKQYIYLLDKYKKRDHGHVSINNEDEEKLSIILQMMKSILNFRHFLIYSSSTRSPPLRAEEINSSYKLMPVPPFQNTLTTLPT